MLRHVGAGKGRRAIVAANSERDDLLSSRWLEALKWRPGRMTNERMNEGAGMDGGSNWYSS